MTLALYFGMGSSEPKILEFFENVGILISAGELSNLLIKDQAGFHAEKDAVDAAGLRSSPWQHTDDTLTRVNGLNQEALGLLEGVVLSKAARQMLQSWRSEADLDQATFQQRLDTWLRRPRSWVSAFTPMCGIASPVLIPFHHWLTWSKKPP